MNVFDQNGVASVVPYDPSLLEFEFEGMGIRNPFVSDCGRFGADPLKDYPFQVVERDGVVVAWRQDLPDGRQLLLTDGEGLQPPVAGKFDDALLTLMSTEGKPVASCMIKDIPFEV